MVLFEIGMFGAIVLLVLALVARSFLLIFHPPPTLDRRLGLGGVRGALHAHRHAPAPRTARHGDHGAYQRREGRAGHLDQRPGSPLPGGWQRGPGSERHDFGGQGQQLSLSRLNHRLPRGHTHRDIMQGTVEFGHVGLEGGLKGRDQGLKLVQGQAAVYLHPADKSHKLIRPTVTRAKRKASREGSHGLPAALSPLVTPSTPAV